MAGARLLAVLILVPGCTGGSGDSGSPAGDGSVTVYSGRNEKLIGPLLDEFETESGIEVEVRYGSTSEMTATILEEADNTPAELFISQDAAALGALSDAGRLLPLPDQLLRSVPARYRSHRGDWVGLSGRARVVVYNTERVEPDALPKSLAEAAHERYRGRFGLAPNNASFQAHMAAYRALNGEQALTDLLAGLAANKPRIYPKNSPIVEAVIAGEIDWGLVNHYYLERALAEAPGAPARNFVMPAPDGSGFVNVAGAGLLGDDPAALQLLRFLTSERARTYFVEQTFEYSLAVDNPQTAGLDYKLDYGAIAAALDDTLTAIQESGLTRFQ